MIEKLSAETVEEWKEHPGTEALLRDLASRHTDQLRNLEQLAAAGEYHGRVNATGGRCAELREVIRMIREAKGTADGT